MRATNVRSILKKEKKNLFDIGSKETINSTVLVNNSLVNEIKSRETTVKITSISTGLITIQVALK